MGSIDGSARKRLCTGKARHSLVASDVQQENDAHFRDVWPLITAKYKREEVWGASVGQMLLWHSAMYCHGEWPLGGALLAVAAAASNGALTNCPNNKLVKLSVWIYNVNHRLTRKRALLDVLAQAVNTLDRLLHEKTTNDWQRAVRNLVVADENRVMPEEPVLTSVGICTQDAEELFMRLSPVWPQLANYDESQAIDLGIVPDSHQLFNGVVVTDEAQSGPLTLVQLQEYVELNSQCCTCRGTGAKAEVTGVVGPMQASSVTVGAVTNIHAACAAKLARELPLQPRFAECCCIPLTQAPVQPFHALPEQLELPIGVSRWRWIKCSHEVG